MYSGFESIFPKWGTSGSGVGGNPRPRRGIFRNLWLRHSGQTRRLRKVEERRLVRLRNTTPVVLASFPCPPGKNENQKKDIEECRVAKGDARTYDREDELSRESETILADISLPV